MAGPLAGSELEVLGRHDHPDVLAGKKLYVSLVTPRGAVTANMVDEVVAPGVLGELGILPGHIPLLAALKPGVFVIRQGAKKAIYAIGGGYLQVGASGQVKAFVESAEEPGEIDVAQAKQEHAAAAEEMKKGGDAMALAQVRSDWAKAKLDAADRAKG